MTRAPRSQTSPPAPSRSRRDNRLFVLPARLAAAAALLLVVGCGGQAGSEGDGSGGAAATGSGGATATGSGGAATTGSGGAATTGSGGATATGSGGATATGSGGATATGSGGAAATGTGGRTGTGGAAPAGTGGRAMAGQAEYWIGPMGADSNPGTMAAPLATLNQGHNYAVAGTTIWVLPGNYTAVAIVSLTKSGTAAAPIKIWAVPGARPVIDFMLQPRGSSSFRGINMIGDYWHIRGIEIKNTGDNCINISGSRNTVENTVVHGCGDSGIQITVDSDRAADATRGAYNTIVNCDSYDNADMLTGGENADGFAAKLYIGPGNVFRGCRAWNNSDDGWDLFAANDVVTMDGCWAFLNGETSSGFMGPDGDGNGFKLGGRPDAGDANMGGAVHRVTNSFAFENNHCGFVRNNNPSTPTVTMSGERSNGSGTCITPSSPVSFTMTGAQAKAVQRTADGSLPAIR